MNLRTYRLIFGTLLIVGLYYQLSNLIYILVVISLWEGISGYSIPTLVNQMRKHPHYQAQQDNSLMSLETTASIKFDAERMVSLFIGVAVGISYVFFFSHVWVIPWFIGFSLLGSGVSGVCPAQNLFKLIGFK